MSKNKSLLLKSLKRTLAIGLPVIAISGFVPTAMNVGVAQAESAGEAVVAEAQSEAEAGKSEAEAGSSEAVSEAEAGASEAEAKAEAEKKY